MKWIKPPKFENGQINVRAEDYITSECGHWRICKSYGPVYLLADLRKGEPVVSGTLQECKERALENDLLRKSSE